MKIKIYLSLVAATLAMAFTQTVQAIPITGNIGFSGGVQLDSTSVLTATKAVAFTNNTVISSSLAFAGIAKDTPVAISAPWTFNSGPLNSFWQVGGFTFDLMSSSIFSAMGSFLNINLSGIVSGNGFDATPFTGTFQVANPSANGLSTFTERLSFSSSAVPDGAMTVTLLGLTCLGMALVKNRLVPRV
jgi:hypothetical protein